MATDNDETAANKELVVRFMQRAQAGDRGAWKDHLAEDCVRVFPRPGIHRASNTDGQAGILENLPVLTLYQPGTLKMEVEHLVAEGPFVAVQFILRATTAAGEPYENFYHHLFECHDGKITKYWEYCDTLYGARMLRPETLRDI